MEKNPILSRIGIYLVNKKERNPVLFEFTVSPELALTTLLPKRLCRFRINKNISD
jgi:hypothetical protein